MPGFRPELRTVLLPALLMFSMPGLHAAMVTELVPLNLQVSGSEVDPGYGNGFDFTSEVLDPFDTSLGQLERVDVSITGQVAHEVRAGENISDSPETGTVVTPYTIETEVFLGFEGETDYFTLFPDLSGMQLFEATGQGDVLFGSADFNLAFRIDADSEGLGDDRLPDAVGYSTGLNYVPLVSGDRGDFLDTNIISDLMLIVLDVDFFIPDQVPGVTLPTTVISTLTGTMQVDYHYSSTSVVPLPAAAWLFAAGLAGLFGFCRRNNSCR